MKWSALIKAVRESRGWTQTELADELGVALSTVSRWEREEAEPRPRQQKMLLKYLQDQAQRNAVLPHSLTPDDVLAARAARVAQIRAAREPDELDVLTKEDKELILALTRWLVSQRIGQQSGQQTLSLPHFNRLVDRLLEGVE